MGDRMKIIPPLIFMIVLFAVTYYFWEKSSNSNSVQILLVFVMLIFGYGIFGGIVSLLGY
jgi:hypothetical protein